MKLRKWEEKCYQAGLSSDFLEKYKEQVQEAKIKRAVVKENTLNTAKQIACALIKNQLADKVYLFGSFARDDYNEKSDLDLYVIGRKGDTGEIYKIAERLCRDRRVSMVFEEDNVPWIEEIINREGIDLC